MSVQALTAVIADAEAKGSGLLMLILLANRESEQGSFMSIDRLANESRMSRRQVVRVLHDLRDVEQLHIHENAGPHGCNLYCILPLARGCLSEQGDILSRDIPGPQMSPNTNELVVTSSSGSKTSTVTHSFEFDEWWKGYPKKVRKGAARIAYIAALKKTDPDTLLTGLRRYAVSVRGVEPRFIAHAATWLRGEGWEDELAASSVPETEFYVAPERNEGEFKAFLAAVGDGPWSKRGAVSA